MGNDAADQAYAFGYGAWRPDAPPPACPYDDDLADLWWSGWEHAMADANRIHEPDDAELPAA